MPGPRATNCWTKIKVVDETHNEVLTEEDIQLKKVKERDDKVVFGNVANKGKSCVLGVSDASYSQ